MRNQKRSQKKIDYMKYLIKKGYPKIICVEKFEKKFSTHRSTAYDWYHIVSTKTNSGHRLNNLRYRYKILKSCYFCGKTPRIQHHIDYKLDITIPLCSSCHGKLHLILRRNTTKNSDKNITENADKNFPEKINLNLGEKDETKS